MSKIKTIETKPEKSKICSKHYIYVRPVLFKWICLLVLFLKSYHIEN